MEENRFAGSIGKQYDLFQLAIPHYTQLQELVGQLIAVHAANLSTKRIIAIEAGTGTGITTSYILNADGRMKVFSIENELSTLTQAKENINDDRVVFVLEDIIEFLLKQPDESVDVFASGFTLHNLQPTQRGVIFKALSKKMKNGGFFVNADKYAQNNPKVQKQALEKQLEAFSVFDERGRPDLREEWAEHYLEDEKIAFTENEQLLLFNAYDFKNVEMPFREGMEAIFTAQKYSSGS